MYYIISIFQKYIRVSSSLTIFLLGSLYLPTLGPKLYAGNLLVPIKQLSESNRINQLCYFPRHVHEQ